MNILNIFNFFKDTVLVYISSYRLKSILLPKELDNYSNSRLDEIIIYIKFTMKFNPLIYNHLLVRESK